MAAGELDKLQGGRLKPNSIRDFLQLVTIQFEGFDIELLALSRNS
jgi:hypothetical protein